MSLFCCALVCVNSSFSIILKRKRKLVALLLLSYRCIVTINDLLLFLAVPWVGLKYVLVVFPDHTHFLLDSRLVDRIHASCCWFVTQRRSDNLVGGACALLAGFGLHLYCWNY